jgi:hypothetical protein
MDKISIIIASLALIISAYQSFLSWNARDDHLEAIANETRLNTCAEIGIAAAEFAALMDPVLQQVKSGRFNQPSFDALNSAKPTLQKAYFIGTYVLGDEYRYELEKLQSNGLEFVSVAFRSDPETSDKANEHYKAFEEAGMAIQKKCKQN